MQAPVYLCSQAGRCDVVASLDADSGVTIRGAWDVERCQQSKDNWPILRDDTLVMLVVIHECVTKITGHNGMKLVCSCVLKGSFMKVCSQFAYFFLHLSLPTFNCFSVRIPHTGNRIRAS